ncbi:Alpha/Beta hydrolase protein [Lineolata rhizophorae]|uniref:Alpha/Beta hydrolase protein n=1 Tax=Lineolata rhizophorae TaxID=578093 RepID=A0A6A6NR96_9PEZI|nr:Alpha/Beta hydrolase protein [Lineolata rhizophorae]
MAPLISSSSLRLPPQASAYVAAGAAASLSVLILRRAFAGSFQVPHPDDDAGITPSPLTTVLPHLTPAEIKALPYPPDALPGARDVPSPYGTFRVYEFGPNDGRKVLFVHGISTPSIGLAPIAQRLAERGCRVMLFDLFGRGFSSLPPSNIPHDTRLYTTQIHLALASSPVSWTSPSLDDITTDNPSETANRSPTYSMSSAHSSPSRTSPPPGFTLVGYSLGGGLAAAFTSHYPNLVHSLVLLAPGGILRPEHVTTTSRLLYYAPRALLPDWLAERLRPRPHSGSGRGPDPDAAPLLADRPASSVSGAVAWQLAHHAGFARAVLGCLREGPIHGQGRAWGRVGAGVAAARGRGREERRAVSKVLVVLGQRDGVVRADEVGRDAREALGEENVVVVVLDAGHGVPYECPEEVVGVMERNWRE